MPPAMQPRLTCVCVCVCAMCRFTKDTESVDTSVSYSVQSFMTCSISVFGAILVVTAVTPTIIVAIALLSIVYYRVQVSAPVLIPVLAGSQLWLIAVVSPWAYVVQCVRVCVCLSVCMSLSVSVSGCLSVSLSVSLCVSVSQHVVLCRTCGLPSLENLVALISCCLKEPAHSCRVCMCALKSHHRL